MLYKVVLGFQPFSILLYDYANTSSLHGTCVFSVQFVINIVWGFVYFNI